VARFPAARTTSNVGGTYINHGCGIDESEQEKEGVQMKYPTCRQLFLKVEGKRHREACELLE
jgi:hypothetical protein